MKRLLITTFIFGSILVAGSVDAQMPVLDGVEGMGNFSNTTVDWNEVVEHTAREEQEGKELWDTLQAKEIACENLNEEPFGDLGEYFMGTLAGKFHAPKNAVRIQQHCEDGEEQIHIVMGKRLSSCDTSASFPAISGGWMPMMNPVRNGASNGVNMMWGGSMMNFGFGPFGSFGWIFMILWWVLIILGLVALIKWLTSQSRGAHNHEKLASPAGGSALNVLKERYVKGEIDKKEFEEKKKDLS